MSSGLEGHVVLTNGEHLALLKERATLRERVAQLEQNNSEMMRAYNASLAIEADYEVLAERYKASTAECAKLTADLAACKSSRDYYREMIDSIRHILGPEPILRDELKRLKALLAEVRGCPNVVSPGTLEPSEQIISVFVPRELWERLG